MAELIKRRWAALREVAARRPTVTRAVLVAAAIAALVGIAALPISEDFTVGDAATWAAGGSVNKVSVVVQGSPGDRVTTPFGVCVLNPGERTKTCTFSASGYGSPTLYAQPSAQASSSITWTGDCLPGTGGRNAHCAVMFQGSSVLRASVAFSAPTPSFYTLTIDVSGPEAGTVTGPGGRYCTESPTRPTFGASMPGRQVCPWNLEAGSTVELRATPLTTRNAWGASFPSALNAWGGACATAGRSDTCRLTLTTNVTVSAVFVAPAAVRPSPTPSPTLAASPAPPPSPTGPASTSRTLTVRVVGGETGGNVILPGGQPCGVVGGAGQATCTLTFPPGATVPVAAQPLATQILTGWTGDCSPGGAAPVCTVQMTVDRTVTATFAKR